MKGIQYKDTFAVQGSELFKLLPEGKMDAAEKSYQDTAHLRSRRNADRIPDRNFGCGVLDRHLHHDRLTNGRRRHIGP